MSDELNAAVRASSAPDRLFGHISALRRYVHSKIPARFRSVLDADDILQEVWFDSQRDWENLSQLGSERLGAWLFKCADHKVIDAVRMEGAAKRGGNRQRVIGQGDGLGAFEVLLREIEAGSSSPSRAFRQEEVRHALAIALSGLGADRRTAINMRYVDGLSHAEIAERMGRTSDAVNGLLYHGLIELRSILGSASRYLSPR